MDDNQFNDLLGRTNKMINQRNAGANSKEEFGERPLSTIATEKAAARGTLVALRMANLIR